MNPFRFFSQDHRWKHLDQVLANTFKKVKQDIFVSLSWIKYFRNLELQQEEKFKQIVNHLTEHQSKIRELEHEIVRLKTIVELHQKKGELSMQLIRAKREVKEDLPEPKNPNRFVEKVTSAINSNRQGYIVQKILDLAEKGVYSTKQIEEVVVREKGLCGRTTFYQYLRDLRNKKIVLQEQKNGRLVLVSAKK